MDATIDRPRYRTSGKVSGLRLLLLAPILFAVSIGVAWCLSWAFMHGWYYLIFTPAVAALFVGVAARWVVRLSRCRNKLLAGILGGLAGLVAFVGYYHMHMVAILGPAAFTRVDQLWDFIRFRMVTDGLFGRQARPPSEITNWVFGGIDLAIVMAVAASMAVSRAGRVYCESCQGWMRRLIVPTFPGTARMLREALISRRLDQIPVPGLFRLKHGQPVANLELEYCTRQSATAAPCPTYLTLKESYKGSNGKPKVDTVARQWSLAADELGALTELFPAFRRATEQQPPAVPPTVTAAGMPAPAAVAIREEVCPGAPYPLDSRWRNLWMILLSLIPLLVTAGGLGLLALAWFGAGQPDAMRLLLGAGGLALTLAGGVVTWTDVDWLSHRYTFQFTCSAIGSRPDAWVAVDGADTAYVAIVPRKNWGPLLSATDRGFLLVDAKRRCLVFEGIQERYRIPAGAIQSCEIEPVISGSTLYAVVVRTRLNQDGLTQIWEIPFRVACRGWGKNRAAIRLARATELQGRIEALHDQPPDAHTRPS